MEQVKDNSTKKSDKGLSHYIRYYFNLNYNTIQGKLTIGFLSLGSVAIILVILTNLQWRSAIQQSKYALTVAADAQKYSSNLQSISKGLVIAWQQKNMSQETIDEAEVQQLKLSAVASRDSLISLSSECLKAEEKSLLVQISNQYNQLQSALEQPVDSASAQKMYSETVQPSVSALAASVIKNEEIQSKEIERAQTEIHWVESRLRWLVPVYVILSFVLAYFIGFFMIVGVLTRIRSLKEYLRELSKGNLPEEIPASQDELNTIIKELNILSGNLREIKEFALYVGKGDFDNNISVFDDEGDLGISLSQMREGLKKVSAEEKKRFWANEGFAHFGDILRSSNDLNILSDKIIQQMVKYMNANQGGLFIIENEDTPNPYLQLKSCYAYNRKKFQEREILPGQGLIGQVWLEGMTTYLRDIPDHYLRITSGLGDSNPRYLLLIPLKVENKIEGVIEIASFHDFQPHEIQFAEKVAESIASTFSNARVVDRTNRLLVQSQQMTEAMKSQEEEMRQNLEELAATQEEVQRILKEVQEKEAFMSDLISSTNDSILTIDHDYKIIVCNKKIQDTYKPYGLNVDKGFPILDVFTDEQKPVYRGYYQRALKGEFFEVIEKYELDKVIQHFSLTYSPIRNDEGQIVAAAVFGKDITDMVVAKQQAERLLEEAQSQTEQLKAQEEEMRQNMEELEATQEEMRLVMTQVQEKERYMSTILDVSKDMIVTIDKDMRVISANAALKANYKHMGFEVDKGFDITTLLSPEEQPKHKAIYARTFAGETVELHEHYQFQDMDRYINFTFTPIQNEHSEVISIAIFAQDVTEITKAKNAASEQAEMLQAQEEVLRQSMEELSGNQEEMAKQLQKINDQKTYYNDIIEGLPDSLLTIDQDFKIVLANSAFKEKFGKYGFPVEAGSDLLEMARQKGEEEEKRFKAPYLKAFGGEKVDVPHRHHFDLDFQVSFNPLKDATGNIIGVSLIAHDITNRLKLQQQTEQLLKESQEQTEELNSQREELHRILKEVQEKEAFMNDLIDSTNDSIITIDRDYKVVLANELIKKTYRTAGIEVGKGFDILSIFTEKQKPVYKKYYDRALNGEFFEIMEKFEQENGIEQFFVQTYSPLRDDEGQIVAAAVFAKEVTETIVAKQQAERLLEEAQSQAEELKAQEEELRQNMEELAATQEEMHRMLMEVQEKERCLTNIIDVSTDSIAIIDGYYKILSFNKIFAAKFEEMGIKMEKGFDILGFLNNAEEKSRYERAFSGEQFEEYIEMVIQGNQIHLIINYVPVRNAQGTVTAIAVYSKDITERSQTEKKFGELIQDKEIQLQQIEELKAKLAVYEKTETKA
ncbi:PAS domain-containing protein [Cytophagaceae bacterium YF14B1]|uniref:PAS domain-containing protein n=1 Tax=Xanthocytophaga flava TaxID=3048013 RepID=A0AAE3U808_9BACT|nr:PAS domain-containing protein [Xanthocytophaga flavus]MDJ1480169.1 PAS domain-containing protein [Xanthocytophaga flavus]